MVNLTFLSDFTKRASDLWDKKKFVFDKTLEVKVDKKNSISWKGKHVLKGSDGPQSKITLTQKEDKLGTLEVEWAVPVANSHPKFTLKSQELGVDEVELVVDGIDKGSLGVTYGAGDQWAVTSTAKYAADKMELDTEFSFAYDKVTFGAQGIMDTEGTFSVLDVGVRLDQDSDRTYALRSKEKFNELQVAFYYKVSKLSEIGTQIDVDMAKGKIGIQAGGSYAMDDTSKLRYALDSKADLKLAYEYQFSSKLQGYVGTKYSLTQNAMSGPIGYKLCFDC